MTNKNISLFLRLALAFAFLYPAIAGFFAPLNWIGYFPPFLLDTIPNMPLLITFEIFEIALALWILSGWKLKYSSTIAFFTLILIIIFGWSELDVIFRDIPIAIIALVLIFFNTSVENKISE